MAYKVKGTCVDVSFVVLGAIENNVYFVTDGVSTIVVDPVVQARRDHGGAWRRKLDAIVLTHRHFDHVARGRAAPPHGATVIASAIVPTPSRQKPSVARSVRSSRARRPSREPRRRAEDRQHAMEGHHDAWPHGRQHVPVPGPAVRRPSGSEAVLIAGDTLFCGSIGRTDFEGGSMSAMRKSLKRLAALPDDTVVLPGHGSLTTIAGERRRVFCVLCVGWASE